MARVLNLRGTGQRTIARLRSSSLSSSGMSDVSANAGDQLHIEHTPEFVTAIGIPCLRRRVGAQAWGQGLTLPGVSTKSSSSPRSLTIRVPVDVLPRLASPAKVL
jgi:hypothetical protein